MMRGVRKVALVPLLAVCCNALSHFDGAGITPSNNPIVTKYHSDWDIGSTIYVEHNIATHAVPGLVIGGVLFFIFASYFANRWCGLCSCFTKCCKKKDSEAGLYRSRKSKKSFKDAKKANKLAHPVVSAILRILIVVLFLGAAAGIAIGCVGSTSFHTSLVSTLQKLDDKASDLNSTLTNAAYTLSTVNISNLYLPNDTISSMEDAASSLIDDANTVFNKGTNFDGIRNMVTLATYFAVALPLLLGFIGAFAARGKLAYTMSVFLPLGILGMWVVFSFHYTVFITNVDTCYAVNNFLVPPGNTTADENASPLHFLFQCTNASTVDDALSYVGSAIVRTQNDLDLATNNQTKDQLEAQLVELTNTNTSLHGLVGCAPVTDLLNSVYTDLCGVMIESSLYLWQTQVALAVGLTVTFFVGLFAEHRVARKRKEDGYNPLLNLNDDDE
jgi:hypothetical protein